MLQRPLVQIENCLKCENEGTCKTCKDGFIANTGKTVCMNETLQCITMNVQFILLCFIFIIIIRLQRKAMLLR